jgi:hypothetical protein
VTELALDQRQRNHFVHELDGVRVTQLVGANRRLTPALSAR